MRGKTKGYSADEISKQTCVVLGCRKSAAHEFRICATAKYHPICAEHDVEINGMVAKFVFGDVVGRALHRKYQRIVKLGAVPSDPQRG